LNKINTQYGSTVGRILSKNYSDLSRNSRKLPDIFATRMATSWEMGCQILVLPQNHTIFPILC